MRRLMPRSPPRVSTSRPKAVAVGALLGVELLCAPGGGAGGTGPGHCSVHTHADLGTGYKLSMPPWTDQYAWG